MFGNMRSTTLLSLSPLPLLLSLFLSLLSLPCTALRIIVTPTTSTNAPTTVYWIREPSDPQPLFDLRFVVQQDGTDVDDVGLAAANVPINVGNGDGETRMGKEEVRFPKTGQYVLKAVSGPTFQVIGTSNEVVVSAPGTITLSTSPTSTSTSTEGKPTETNETGFNGSSPQPPKSKTPLIIGAVLGSLLFLLLTALLLWFLVRRRRLARERDRLSFRPEDMIQRRRSRSRPQWVSGLSLRVQARSDEGGNGPASAPVGGPVGENPFATPARTPPGNRDREVSFAQPLTPSATNVLASVPPSRRELIARELRESSASASIYSQNSNTDVDVEAQSTEAPTLPPKEKRRSGAWTLVEQALANVKRRASMVSRSSVAESRSGTPVPVSASPYVTSFAPTTMTTAPPTLSVTNANPVMSTIGIATTTAPEPTNMAQRAGKRISILPPLSVPPQAHVRGLPPVPLGPVFEFDAGSVLSGSEGDGGTKSMSEKVKGKQRSDSILRPALASPSKLETIPGSPATTVSGSVGHSLPVVVPAPPPPPPAVTPEEKEKKEKESRPLPSVVPLPTIHAPVPSVPVVPPSPVTRSFSKRPLPSPLVLKSASFSTSAFPASKSIGGPALKSATLTRAATSATLRALPPLPPTPATGAFPRSAVPYTPSFPIPTIPSYDLPSTPVSAVPAVLTPAIRDGDLDNKSGEGVQRTPSYTRDTVPPVLRTYTKRQRHIEHRIGQVKVQLRLLKRKIDSSQVDADVGRRVVQDLQKQLAWLELHLYGAWALEEEGSERPEEWGRYMRP